MELGAEVHRSVPKLFRAEVTRAEHRLPQQIVIYKIVCSLIPGWASEISCYLILWTIHKNIWLGIHDSDKEGKFVETTEGNAEGKPIQFDMWNKGEPNDSNGEDAVHIVEVNSTFSNALGPLQAGLWNDADVDNKYIKKYKKTREKIEKIVFQKYFIFETIYSTQTILTCISWHTKVIYGADSF